MLFRKLKLEKGLFNNTFFRFIFRNKMIVHTAEKNQIKDILLKINWVKSNSSMYKLLLEFPAAVINYFFTV